MECAERMDGDCIQNAKGTYFFEDDRDSRDLGKLATILQRLTSSPNILFPFSRDFTYLN